MKFLKSKRSPALKSKIIESSHENNARKNGRTRYLKNNAGVVDLSSVDEWVQSNNSGLQDCKKYQKTSQVSLKTQLHATEGSSDLSSVTKERKIDSIPQDNATTLMTDENSDPESQNMPELLLGRQNPDSPYFTRKHVRVSRDSIEAIPGLLASLQSSASANHDSQLLEMPDLDPQAFELLQIWRHTGNVPIRIHSDYAALSSPEYTWQMCWPLMNAHILGSMLSVVEFADRIMDILREKLGGSRPDLDTISHLFTSTLEGIPDVLRWFVVDQYIAATVQDEKESNGQHGVQELDVATLPPKFAGMLLNALLRQVSLTSSPPNNQQCKYHTHGVSEDCYRKKNHEDFKRKLKCDLARQRSQQDSERVKKNVQANGVAAIDWADHEVTTHCFSGEQMNHARRVDNCIPTTGPEAKEGSNDPPVQNVVESVHDHITVGRLLCPGAFPISRNGSVRSIT